MRIVLPRRQLRLIVRVTLRCIQTGLFAVALSMLGWCGFVVADAWLFGNTQSRRLDAMVRAREADTAAALPGMTPRAVDGLVGRLQIQRLGISVVVMEGTGPKTLRRAAGHIEGTSLPGETGNVGISAHRDTFFRELRNVHRNDVVTLTTPSGEYRYSVVSVSVVNPDNMNVLKNGASEVLTLVTCYPFYFVGAAPQRFIVRAERVT
jgi:sortase A